MSIERTLVLNSEDESINLDVDSFRYSGGINRGYQIEMIAFADKSTSLKGFTGARFEFNYGGQNIDSATIRGFVREIGTSFDNKQNRVQFRIVGKSIISYLGEYYYNKMYGEASVDSIISDMLLTTCNTQTKYNEREHSFFEDPADRQSQAIGEIQYGAFEVGKDKFYIIHTMMNYKFQGYNDKNGSLLDKEVNETNAGILAKGTNQSEKTRYNLVFNAMKGFEELWRWKSLLNSPLW